MSRGMGAFWGALLAALALTQAAAAQTPAPTAYPPPALPLGVFPVVIESGEYADASYELSYEDGPPFARCNGACAFYGYPARYKLTARGPGYAEGTRRFELMGPSRVIVEPRSEGRRSGGLAMAIIGMTLTVVGFAVMSSEDGGGSSNEDLFVLGLAAFATGATLTPIGFVRFGQSAPAVSVQPL